MNTSRKRYNWRARQVVETEVDNTSTKRIKLELSHSKPERYDESNPLALPAKKRSTKLKAPVKSAPVKPLSRKRKKLLEKIVAKKQKKTNRAELFEALAKVQAKPEDMKLYVATSCMQTKGFKQHSIEQVRLLTSDKEEVTIRSVRGSNRKPKSAPVEVEDTTDESGSGSGSSDDEKEEKDDNGDSSTVEDPQTGSVVAQQVDVVDKQDEGQHSDKEMPLPSVANPPAATSRAVIFKPVARLVEMEEARSKLPIMAEEQVIMEAIHDNPIVVLCGETGSGKTTQVPQFLYEAGYTSDQLMIGVTQPRRVAAVTMSHRVAQEMNFPTDKVSYQIRYEGNVTDQTEIKFVTDGVLLKEMQNDFLLSRYSVIIVDEAHERSVFTDILVGLLSRIVPLRNKRNKPLKLVIMSATLRVEDFTENRRLFKLVPPVVRVESRQYPVAVHFNKKTADDYLSEAFRKACKIHRRLPNGGILVFLTGQQEVNILCHKLQRTFPLTHYHKTKLKSRTDDTETSQKASPKEEEEVNKIKQQHSQSSDPDDAEEDGAKKPSAELKQPDVVLPKINLDDYAIVPGIEEDVIQEEDRGSEIGDLLSDDDDVDGDDDEKATAMKLGPENPMYVLPLYSLLPGHKQAQVFRPPPDGCRLCVVATNVAETSITIPNIRYVIDCGKVKTRIYDRVTGVSAFQVTWTSKAAANQRAGRAGRTGSGHCYRLYSSAVFNDDFAQFSSPEICRRPVDDLVLQLKEMNIDRVLNFPFPTPVDEESIKASEQRLMLLGALEQQKTCAKPKDLKQPEFCAKITALGRAMASFPVAPRYGKMLALGHQHNLLPYVIGIVAAFTVQEVLCENHLTVRSFQEKTAIKDKKVYWKQIRRTWAGQGDSQALGDAMVLLKAVGATEFAGCTPVYCEQHGLRFKAMTEIRKLRIQLTNAVNLVLPSANLCVDPQMLPPTDLEAKQLRQILLAGLPDSIARKVPESEIKGDNEEKRKWKKAYRASHLEEPIFLHPNSVLFHKLPEYVVYQEIFETSKMFMRGLTAIEPEWIMIFCPYQCTFSKPLDKPEPRYDAVTGTVKCYMTASFGKCAWQLPAAELDYPEGIDRVRWFARFLLEGLVCPKLAKFRNELVSPPSTMIKSWSRLQPKTETLLNCLLHARVDSKESLSNAWKKDKTYLLTQYMEWVPESSHFQLSNLWPPL